MKSVIASAPSPTSKQPRRTSDTNSFPIPLSRPSEGLFPHPQPEVFHISPAPGLCPDHSN